MSFLEAAKPLANVGLLRCKAATCRNRTQLVCSAVPQQICSSLSVLTAAVAPLSDPESRTLGNLGH